MAYYIIAHRIRCETENGIIVSGDWAVEQYIGKPIGELIQRCVEIGLAVEMRRTPPPDNISGGNRMKPKTL